jgi:hypothetical protein
LLSLKCDFSAVVKTQTENKKDMCGSDLAVPSSPSGHLEIASTGIADDVVKMTSIMCTSGRDNVEKHDAEHTHQKGELSEQQESISGLSTTSPTGEPIRQEEAQTSYLCSPSTHVHDLQEEAECLDQIKDVNSLQDVSPNMSHKALQTSLLHVLPPDAMSFMHASVINNR